MFNHQISRQCPIRSKDITKFLWRLQVPTTGPRSLISAINLDQFCALSVGWICPYISVWWQLETTTNSTVVLSPLSCSNSLGFLSDCISYFPQFCHTSIISFIGFSCTHPPLAAFAKPHTERIPHPYVSSIIISILLLLSFCVKSSLEITLHHILLSFYFACYGPWHAKIWTPLQSQMVDEHDSFE